MTMNYSFYIIYDYVLWDVMLWSLVDKYQDHIQMKMEAAGFSKMLVYVHKLHNVTSWRPYS
jgi:hypothetical protein